MFISILKSYNVLMTTFIVESKSLNISVNMSIIIYSCNSFNFSIFWEPTVIKTLNAFKPV